VDELLVLNVRPAVSDEHKELILKMHAGHNGYKHVAKMLRQFGHKWQYMDRDVKTVLRSCEPCQKWNIVPKVYHPLRSIFSAMPWDHIQIDYITHFATDETPDGYKYILVVVDVFSGYSVSVATKTRSAAELMDVLWELFGHLGVPKILQSDNEASFVCELMDAFMSRLRVRHVTCVPCVHRQMGKVENVIKSVSLAIHKYISELGGNWKDHLPDANMTVNSKIKESHGFSPFQLFFNRPMSVFDDFKPLKLDEKGASAEQIAQWVEFQKKISTELNPAVALQIKSDQQRQRERFAREHIISEEKVPLQAMVMVYDPVRHGKRQPPYVGPYTVEQYNADGSYMLDDMVGASYHRAVTRDQLKVLTGALASDSQIGQWYVDYIIQQRFNKYSRENEYLVRWVGFDESHDEWVLARHFADENVIREFNVGKKVLLKTRKGSR
jgi:hypothetical protein